MKINTYLNFSGNAEEAMNFYKSIFGGEFTSVMRFKDMPEEEAQQIPEKYKEKIMHISLPLGSNILMASDVLEDMDQKITFGNNSYISLHPDSKQQADTIFSALAQGGNIEMPLENQFWGDYFGCLQDKFGICWMVNFYEE